MPLLTSDYVASRQSLLKPADSEYKDQTFLISHSQRTPYGLLPVGVMN